MAGGYRVRIATALASEVKPGDSLAVNGVCLTVILADGGEVHADVGPGDGARDDASAACSAGRASTSNGRCALDGRLGGHLVQGHVDGIGTVDDVRAGCGLPLDHGELSGQRWRRISSAKDRSRSTASA